MLMKFAFRFWFVDAQGIELGRLMQKALLRRNRNDRAAIGKQDGLPQLLVPAAQGLLLSLEGGNREIGSSEVAANDIGLARASA